MVKKQSSLVTLKSKSSHKTKKTKYPKKDPCIVCDKNLYYNADYSKRVGLIDSDSVILGWMCPFCTSEFTADDKLVTLKLDYDGKAGEA